MLAMHCACQKCAMAICALTHLLHMFHLTVLRLLAITRACSHDATCHAVTWIPRQEVTIVTGKGLTTGCRQFVAVGVMLALMQSLGVVKQFWPISDCGAYRVVLGVPM